MTLETGVLQQGKVTPGIWLWCHTDIYPSGINTSVYEET